MSKSTMVETYEKDSPKHGHGFRVKRLVGRFLSSFRTNETQVTSVLGFTALNLLACAQSARPNPVWVWIMCGLFWPGVAWFYNLIDPMPKQKGGE